MNARCYILHRKIPLCRETWGGLLLLRNSVQSSLLIPPGFAGRRENYWLCGTSKVSRIYILFKVETVIRQQCLIVSEGLHDLWWVIFCWSGEQQKSSCKSWRCTSAAELEGAAWEQLLVRLVQNGLFLIFVPYCQGSPLVLIGSWTVCVAAVNLRTVAELGCGLHLLHVKGLEVSAASPSCPVPSLRGPHCPPSWHTGSALGCWGSGAQWESNVTSTWQKPSTLEKSVLALEATSSKIVTGVLCNQKDWRAGDLTAAWLFSIHMVTCGDAVRCWSLHGYCNLLWKHSCLAIDVEGGGDWR